MSIPAKCVRSGLAVVSTALSRGWVSRARATGGASTTRSSRTSNPGNNLVTADTPTGDTLVFRGLRRMKSNHKIRPALSSSTLAISSAIALRGPGSRTLENSVEQIAVSNVLSGNGSRCPSPTTPVIRGFLALPSLSRAGIKSTPDTLSAPTSSAHRRFWPLPAPTSMTRPSGSPVANKAVPQALCRSAAMATTSALSGSYNSRPRRSAYTDRTRSASLTATTRERTTRPGGEHG